MAYMSPIRPCLCLSLSGAQNAELKALQMLKPSCPTILRFSTGFTGQGNMRHGRILEK